MEGILNVDIDVCLDEVGVMEAYIYIVYNQVSVMISSLLHLP